MPFCTKCGANVAGAFCSQCGTPANANATTPFAQAAPIPAGPQPVVRRTSPLVWVLVIILGFFVLAGAGTIGFIAFVGHRLHRAGVSFDRGPDGALTLHSRGRDGGDATVHIGGNVKVPSWLPVYPGSEGRAHGITGRGDDGEGGSFSFTTSDSPGRVKDFYADKIRDMGMRVNLDTTSPDGGTLVAADEDGDRRSLTIAISGHMGGTTVNVTYGRK